MLKVVLISCEEELSSSGILRKKKVIYKPIKSLSLNTDFQIVINNCFNNSVPKIGDCFHAMNHYCEVVKVIMNFSLQELHVWFIPLKNFDPYTKGVQRCI